LLWTRGYVDDLATGVLSALDTRVADGLAVNLGERQTMPVGWSLQQILIAAGSDATLVRVSDLPLPGDLAITAALAQHLLVSVARAQALLDWAPGDPATRIAESVHWHRASSQRIFMVRAGHRHRRCRPRERASLTPRPAEDPLAGPVRGASATCRRSASSADSRYRRKGPEIRTL
jgi:hypothetical protein